MHRCLAPALLLAFTSVILADELRGKVVSIADGDTGLIMPNRDRIRNESRNVRSFCNCNHAHSL